MNVLVTGGAGFVGGHLAERFAADGHDVIALDNFDPYYDDGLKRRNVAAARAAVADGGAYELVEGDVRDEALVADLVADADVVFLQAAQAGVRTDVEPQKYDAVNVDGTLNVLDAARAGDVERVVLASSSSVYGGREELLPFAESDPTFPVSVYGSSKLAAERYAMAYHEAHDLPTVALRYFTVYGPRMRPNMAISNFVSRCAAGRPPVVYGDGTKTRDFTYVADVVDANERLLETDAADGEVVNVGSTTVVSIRDLAEAIRDRIDPDLSIEHAAGFDVDADHTRADVSKARELLGYEPSYGIEAGVDAFVDWYRENREWYEPLVSSG